MKFNVNAFRQDFAQKGYVQTNKYSVEITPENPLSGAYVGMRGEVGDRFITLANDLTNRCVAASLPGLTLRTQDNNRYGVGVLEKMPYAGQYTDIDLTFICDKFGKTYNLFNGWLNYIFASVGERAQNPVDRKTPGRVFYTTQYKNNYSATITITVYDNSGQSRLAYTLYKAFPISINDTPLSWEDNNKMIRLQTKITFREWAIADGQAILQ